MKKILERLRANPIYRKYEMFVPPVITTLVVIILLVAVIVPNIFQFFETSKKIEETESQLTFFEQKESLLKSVNKDQYTEGINRSFAILPNDKEAPSAIAQLYYILGLTNMSVDNIAFSDAGSATDAKSFKISLEMKGSLSGMTNFIIELKKAPRIMRINTLEINGAGTSSDITASLTIDAFYEPLPTNISSLEQPVSQPSEKDLAILNNLATTSFPTIGNEKDYTGPKGKTNPFDQ